jgi:hypothetical protein
MSVLDELVQRHQLSLWTPLYVPYCAEYTVRLAGPIPCLEYNVEIGSVSSARIRARVGKRERPVGPAL